jgi:hypothetical protein
MNMHAIVRLDNCLAHYQIEPEAPGVFHAVLQRLVGNPAVEIPSRIILFRSYRRWIGSVDQPLLLEQIGKVIESNFSNPPSEFPPESTTSMPLDEIF